MGNVQPHAQRCKRRVARRQRRGRTILLRLLQLLLLRLLQLLLLRLRLLLLLQLLLLRLLQLLLLRRELLNKASELRLLHKFPRADFLLGLDQLPFAFLDSRFKVHNKLIRGFHSLGKLGVASTKVSLVTGTAEI